MGPMKSVALLTDSSACLPLDLPLHLGIRVLPIRIHLRSRDIDDGTTEASELVYGALARREPVKSSAPTAVEYLTAIEEAVSDSVVVITPAAEFTGMYRNAAVAAEISGRPAIVVDSRTAAAAQVGPVALGLARQLGIRPVFRLSDGVVERLGVPRSPDAVVTRICREAQARGLEGAPRAMVFHAASADGARRLQTRLGLRGPMAEFSPSMGIHTGPGVIGVAWLRTS
jgi:fatty acid-binding protein DegV